MLRSGGRPEYQEGGTLICGYEIGIACLAEQCSQASSLKGAALAQGAMFVMRMRESLPDLNVTETHPKALLKALNVAGSMGLFCGHNIELPDDQTSEHGRDAMISALAAREGFEGRWHTDLSPKRLQAEQDPRRYWLAPVHYYWPDA